MAASQLAAVTATPAYPLVRGAALALTRGGWRSTAWLVLGGAGPVYLWCLWLLFGSGRGGGLDGLAAAAALAFAGPLVVAALAIIVVAGHCRASPAKP